MSNVIIINNGYISSTATTSYGTDVNADEVELMLRHQPPAPDGYVNMLKADTLEWEAVEVPNIEIPQELTEEDYKQALIELGVLDNNN